MANEYIPEGRVGEMLRTTVRPLVTLALTAGLVYGFVDGQIGADVYTPIALTAVGFWFGARGVSS